jgi:dynein heavy chain
VQATETQKNINVTREIYRPVAARGSLMYFMIDMLNVLDRVYQYSMAGAYTRSYTRTLFSST